MQQRERQHRRIRGMALLVQTSIPIPACWVVLYPELGVSVETVAVPRRTQQKVLRKGCMNWGNRIHSLRNSNASRRGVKPRARLSAATEQQHRQQRECHVGDLRGISCPPRPHRRTHHPTTVWLLMTPACGGARGKGVEGASNSPSAGGRKLALARPRR